MVALNFKKVTLQKKATIIASATSFALVIIKVIIGIISGSVAVLASAIDSILDLVISMFNFFAVTKSEEEANQKFNYGKGKIEALAAVIEGTIIIMSGLYIFYMAIEKAINEKTTQYLDISIVVMLISIAITAILVLFLNHVAKKTNSLVIKSDALHYKTDLFTNAAIIFSLVAVKFSGFEIIDSIVGSIIAVYIIYSAYMIIKEGVYMLLDGSLDQEMVQKIEDAIKNTKGVTDYHFLKTRRSGKVNFVDVHLVFHPEILLIDAHEIGDRVEEKIHEIDKTSEWVINIHLDPYDDSGLHDKK